jgi:hypothetical protein
MRASHAQVTVDFELDSEPIAGSLQHADRTTTFNGWIELVAMLQKAATSPARHAPAADPASNGATRTRQPLDAAIVLPAPRPTIGIVAIRRSADVRRTFAKSRAFGEERDRPEVGRWRLLCSCPAYAPCAGLQLTVNAVVAAGG